MYERTNHSINFSFDPSPYQFAIFRIVIGNRIVWYCFCIYFCITNFSCHCILFDSFFLFFVHLLLNVWLSFRLLFFRFIFFFCVSSIFFRFQSWSHRFVKCLAKMLNVSIHRIFKFVQLFIFRYISEMFIIFLFFYICYFYTVVLHLLLVLFALHTFFVVNWKFFDGWIVWNLISIDYKHILANNVHGIW